MFVKNFTPAHSPTVKITAENVALLRSGYQARTEKELPVLNRWFPKGSVETTQAVYLDVILYSREQILQEKAAMKVVCVCVCVCVCVF